MKISLSNRLPLLAFLLWSCFFQALTAQNRDTPVESGLWDPVFLSSFHKSLYKGSMDISGRHLSGLFFIKRISDSSIRVLFSNEIGMKFFDLEVSPDHFMVHYCYPSLNKKIVLSILENDFRILFFNGLDGKRNSVCTDSNSTGKVYKVKDESGSWYYYVNNEQKITTIQSRCKMIKKTHIDLDKYLGNVPSSVTLQNKTIGLIIRIKRIGD